MAYSTYMGMEIDQSDWPADGDKMRFRNRGGWDGERENAAKVFTEGQIVTVKSCAVGRSSHAITFEEVPGSWNGCMFDWIADSPRAREWNFPLGFPEE